jgi:hypothetical protein
MNGKKLYQIIKEKQVIAVLLAKSEKECESYAINHLVDDLKHTSIIEVAKQEIEEEDSVVPLMVAKKSRWYDLRHYRHLYIYESK